MLLNVFVFGAATHLQHCTCHVSAAASVPFAVPASFPPAAAFSAPAAVTIAVVAQKMTRDSL